ncbi:alpha/beta fold hydrolase [Fictibacillus sp. KU28468]|uniref:alpha/beta fold hydrolase n=1 Tax=Fictibacillus sp. KU28468 TaxID=2991053 RepID=UPI00223E8876|nr:hypothetical protein [Fictibacillus sp. KU28468]UZJ80909.1 hypothetical protein OKX00_10925 [Fictibacillus sp. KU28468]
MGDILRSQRELNGDYWKEWTVSSVPALLKRVLSSEHAQEMVSKRPNTELVSIEAGHAVYFDNPECYREEIINFMSKRGFIKERQI